MQLKIEFRHIVALTIAFVIAAFAVLDFGVVERVAYLVERGRLQALRETLPTDQHLDQLNNASRTVAAVASAAVVSIEAEFGETRVDGRVRSSDNVDSSDRHEDEGDRPDPSRRGPGASPPAQIGLGAGFVYSSDDGYILTNAHVVAGATAVHVTLPGGIEEDARVLGADPVTDLAVIQVDRRLLHELPFGDSGDLQVGDAVLAVGNPFGLGGTVTKGIISAVNRKNVRIGGETSRPLLQTDAAISPGSSGGPLLDLGGRVVGINTAMVSEEAGYKGVGFAIPASRAVSLLDDLVSGGPGILGVLVWSVNDPAGIDDLRALGWSHNYGAVVDEVFPDTAADRAGVKRHDVIVAVDGARIDNISVLGHIVGDKGAGAKVRVKFWRDGQMLVVPVALGRRYAPR